MGPETAGGAARIRDLINGAAEVETAGGNVSRYFTPLGVHAGVYHYMTASGLDVALKSHGQQSLLKICPRVEVWAEDFPGPHQKALVDWLAAAAFAIRICEIRDYDPNTLRGRGIWFDEGRAIFNLGTSLVVDGGKPMPLGQIRSRFVYQRGPVWPISLAAALDDRDAFRLLGLFEMFNFEDRKIAAVYLGGWIVCAIACGALKWRPHLILCAENQAGKSWVIEHLLMPTLGPLALFQAGQSTEAAIRRELGLDAMSVVLDEFGEVDDQPGLERLKAIYDLALLASSDSTSQVMKASGDDTRLYRIRGCFLFSVVNRAFRAYAQSSRMTTLELLKDSAPGSVDRFKARQSATAELLTPDWCAGLRARAFSLAPVIRDNAVLLAETLSGDMDRREADQLGALLAGAFALQSCAALTSDSARRYLENLPQRQNRRPESDQPPPDQEALWHKLLQTVVPVERIEHDDPRSARRSFGEIFEALHAGASHPEKGLFFHELHTAAARNGIYVDQNVLVDHKTGEVKKKRRTTWIYIPNHHKELERHLGMTGWNDVFSRLPECTGRGFSKRILGDLNRCVKINYDRIRRRPDTPRKRSDTRRKRSDTPRRRSDTLRKGPRQAQRTAQAQKTEANRG
jgi:putative DNA primase/helicase